jgi:hypothetical protein
MIILHADSGLPSPGGRTRVAVGLPGPRSESNPPMEPAEVNANHSALVSGGRVSLDVRDVEE